MNWFSSDWHLDHTAIIKYCHRPFANAEEMNALILKNFFDTVKSGDRFFYLGDLSFHKEVIERFINSLGGIGIKSVFLVGNHDNFSGGIRQLAKSFGIEIIDGFLDINIDGQPLTLCHYPMTSFYKSHFGAWQLHGHHHTDVSQIVTGKKMNVGVDLHNFLPISWDKIKAYMAKRSENWDTIHESDGHKRF